MVGEVGANTRKGRQEMSEEVVSITKSVHDDPAVVTIEFAAPVLEEIARIIYEYPDFVSVNRGASEKMLEFLDEALRAGEELRVIVKRKLDEQSEPGEVPKDESSVPEAKQ